MGTVHCISVGVFLRSCITWRLTYILCKSVWRILLYSIHVSPEKALDGMYLKGEALDNTYREAYHVLKLLPGKLHIEDTFTRVQLVYLCHGRDFAFEIFKGLWRLYPNLEHTLLHLFLLKYDSAHLNSQLITNMCAWLILCELYMQ